MSKDVIIWLKSLVPLWFKIWIMSQHRKHVFRLAMRKLIANPALIEKPSNNLISKLIYGWGNTGWSAQGEYLLACAREARLPGGDILECGSGLSTLVLAAVASSQNRSLIALEHNSDWYRHVNDMILKLGIRNAKVIHTPIISYEGFDWYDVPEVVNQKLFDLVICDGPPADTKGGRYGLVPVLSSRFARNSKIYLDDAQRFDEQKAAHEWSLILSASCITQGEKKPYIIVKMGGN